MNGSKTSKLVWGGVVVSVLALATMGANPDRASEKKPRDVTLTGKIVDLHSFMTGKFASSDAVRSTQACIQAGVPAALETADGLILIGQGPKGPRKILARLAYAQVEMKGRLYERGGLRYIDVSDVKPAKRAEEMDDEEYDDPGNVEPDPEDPEDEPEPAVRGACCLSEGDCVDTEEARCTELGGDFYRGELCDEIECPSRRS